MEDLNNFMTGLTQETRTSKTQSQMLIARKLRERATLLTKIRNQKQKMERIARSLRFDYQRLEILQSDINGLQTSIDNGVDDL